MTTLMRTPLLVLLFTNTAVAARYRADFELPLKVFGNDGSWNATAYYDDSAGRIEVQHSVAPAEFEKVTRHVASSGNRGQVGSQITFIREKIEGVLFSTGTNMLIEFDPANGQAVFYPGDFLPAGIIFWKSNSEMVGFIEVPRGDVDGDRDVDFADFLIVSANFDQNANSLLEGDLNFSGTVDFGDFLFVSDDFGTKPAVTASVPEPSSWSLFALMLTGWWRRRVR